MSDWVTVRADQLSTVEPARTERGHSMRVVSKHVQWPAFCSRCGHVKLKNDISQLVTRIGCDYARDPRFIAWERGLRR